METKTTPDCATCKNSIFDEKWGEYKCINHQLRVYSNIFKFKSCKFYERRTTDDKK